MPDRRFVPCGPDDAFLAPADWLAAAAYDMAAPETLGAWGALEEVAAVSAVFAPAAVSCCSSSGTWMTRGEGRGAGEPTGDPVSLVVSTPCILFLRTGAFTSSVSPVTLSWPRAAMRAVSSMFDLQRFMAAGSARFFLLCTIVA